MTNKREPPVAVITGASSGLGLALATAARRRGYRVYLVARGEEGLARAVESINASIGEKEVSHAEDMLVARAADVTDADSTAAAIAGIAQIDLLINCAGKSDRGRFLVTDAGTLEQLFRLNVLSILNVSKAALPGLRAARGVVVNIGSLAGKVAPRFLGAYPATKFAVSGLSQQMRLELAEDGIAVLLVCPGPIRRDDAGQRYRDRVAAGGAPDSAAAPGGGAKLKGLDPDALAEQILDAAKERKAELILPSKVRWLLAVGSFFPKLADRLLRNKTA